MHIAADAAGAASLEAGDRGSGHLAKTGGTWASIVAAAAAERLHGLERQKGAMFTIRHSFQRGSAHRCRNQ